ncbi:hypothetical protein GDO81_012341 [Engystomops pustulosus]|uniref:Uncharacterized protein n=1 Tax=Engystomops pustulosus TaxID=76066 RepID=A0AAV7BLM9_ENGPU|nr:hypothetical protein GDO81_012341 [Engystomops pustulosus]
MLASTSDTTLTHVTNDRSIHVATTVVQSSHTTWIVARKSQCRLLVYDLVAHTSGDRILVGYLEAPPLCFADWSPPSVYNHNVLRSVRHDCGGLSPNPHGGPREMPQHNPHSMHRVT